MKKTIVIIGTGPELGMAVAKKFGTEGFQTILVARNEENDGGWVNSAPCLTGYMNLR